MEIQIWSEAIRSDQKATKNGLSASTGLELGLLVRIVGTEIPDRFRLTIIFFSALFKSYDPAFLPFVYSFFPNKKKNQEFVRVFVREDIPNIYLPF